MLRFLIYDVEFCMMRLSPQLPTSQLSSMILNAILSTGWRHCDVCRQTWAGYFVAIMLSLFLAHRSALGAEEFVSSSREVSRIEAGTSITEDSMGRWNRIVLLARPRISSGDVDRLPSAIRDSVSQFVLTIMASVEPFADPSTGQARYQLTDVGIGYSAEIKGEMKVVTVAEADKVGLKLGLFTRLMLAENEKQLATAKLAARTSTLMIIDAKSFVLRGSEHKEYLMRHFVWVDPRTGRTAALVWLIKSDPTRGYVVEADEPPRWAPAGLREDRAIHVDGQQFNFIGIPNEKAFAVEKLPPGKPIPWTDEAKAIAATVHFDIDSLLRISTALNNMLQAVK